MDRVAILYAEISAATREFLAALAESDRHRDWEEEGFGSCAEWLAWRIGVTRNTANEKVRAARSLESLPLTAAAMARGELSFSKVRALTRVATPDNEARLLELARAGSAAKLEQVVRSWKRLDREDDAAWERARHQVRCLSVFPDEDGMYVVRGRLEPEVGAVLMRAIEAASDALFAAERRDPSDEHPDPRQRRADAVGLLAERALAAGFGKGGDQLPVSGSRAARYQVMLHVDPSTLRNDGEPGRSEMEDGTRVTAVTARRLSCDAGLVEVRHAPGGSVIDAGRKTRTIPAALRRALTARDGGCRFPGCRSRFVDAHHIVHWADGGETSLRNCASLCPAHHRRVHEGGWKICIDKEGQVVFFTPRGKAISDASQPPTLEDAATEHATTGDAATEEATTKDATMEHAATEDAPEERSAERLIAGNRARGLRPDGRAIAAKYHNDHDVPHRIEAAAWEALDPADRPEAAVECPDAEAAA